MEDPPERTVMTKIDKRVIFFPLGKSPPADISFMNWLIGKFGGIID